MELAKYKACICEGSAEEAIIAEQPISPKENTACLIC